MEEQPELPREEFPLPLCLRYSLHGAPVDTKSFQAAPKRARTACLAAFIERQYSEAIRDDNPIIPDQRLSGSAGMGRFGLEIIHGPGYGARIGKA